jgi:hypothetical protein
MALTQSTQLRNAIAAAVGAEWAGGSVDIRSGSKPASAESAATGTLLGSVSVGAAGTPSAGTVVMADPAADTWDADGIAGWFRAKDDAGATLFDGTVTNNTGSGDMKLSNTTAVDGSPIDLSTVSYTAPSGE